MNSIFRIFLLLLISHSLIGQVQTKSVSEYGHMYPLTGEVINEYQERYGIAEQKWYQNINNSTLRFNGGCSSSFVSKSGLLVTAAHCCPSIELQNPDLRANVFNNGYLAKSLNEELKSTGLVVEQLIVSVNITDELNLLSGNSITKGRINALKSKYSATPGFKGLSIEVKRYFNDKRIILNGYRKYKDIRLVFVPRSKVRSERSGESEGCEPIYDFDVAFWRVYENGIPLNTKANHLKINQFNTKKGETVFVAGYPGKTDRYKSPAELQYLADQVFKYKNESIKDQITVLKQSVEQSQEIEESDYVGQMCKIRAVNSLNQAINSSKGMTFVLEKLNEPETIERVNEIANKVSFPDEYFELNAQLKKNYDALSQDAWAMMYLSPSLRETSWEVLFLHRLEKYRQSIIHKESESKIKSLMQDAFSIGQNFGSQSRESTIKEWLKSIEKDIPTNDSTLSEILDGKSVEEYVSWAFAESGFGNYKSSKATIENRNEMIKMTDPLAILANKITERYTLARERYMTQKPIIDSLNKRLIELTYNTLGKDIMPNADGTLRLSDGHISGYNYCGFDSKNTTFNSIILSDATGETDQALLDNLPKDYTKRLAFISTTNDGTRGNSGSPLINREGEFIGLVFKQGNVSEFPNDYIYNPNNRAISIHAQAIYLCMKYIYGADKLISELLESAE